MNMLEVFSLSALVDFAEARASLRPVLDWAAMFTFPHGMAIADWAMGSESHLIGMLEPDERALVAQTLDDMEWMRPTDAPWACHCVREFVRDARTRNGVETLRWAADQVQAGRMTLVAVAGYVS